MSLVISSDVVLDAVASLSLDHPLIGWHNVVTSANIAADTEQSNYPASNLATPATHERWKASVLGAQYLTITMDDVDPIDYVAIAGHNFWSAGISVQILGYHDGAYHEITDDVILPDDGPALFRFELRSYENIRIYMAAGSAAPQAAVIYCGALLVMERKVWVGHTPVPHGRKSSVANGRSESGQFLGRIVLGSWRESTIPLSLISPDWYRENMDEFLADAQRDLPFFFAWRPETYPREVGYCVLMDDPAPTPVGPSNLLAFDLKVRGVA